MGGGLHRRAVALLATLREVEAPDAEVGAPAPLGVAALLEQRGEIRESFGRQGADVEGRRHRDGW